MTEVFYAVAKASFQGSIVILAVLILRLLLKKAPKSLFCLLWLLAGLRLALPFEIQSPFSLQPRLEETNITVQAEKPVQVPGQMGFDSQPQQMPNLPQQSPELPDAVWEDMQTVTIPYHVENGVITEPVSYGDIAAGIWVLGMAGMLAASAVSYFRLKRRVREACLVENGCYECPGLDTAFVLGFLPPKIYLPVGLSDREKAFIYDHENTHIARHDHWFKLLGYLVLSIHWFNPLVWLAYHLLCRDMELACDEHVVRNMTLPERKAYSSALLSCGSHTAWIAACPVAFGESNPKRRIMNVLNYKKPTFWISLLAVIAVIFVSVCLLTSPKEGEPLERLSKALEDYQSKGSWHIQAEYTYENRLAATGCRMDIWQEENRWYRVSTMELADGNLQTTGYVSENDVQYTFFVSGVYHPEYRRWSLAEGDQRWYPYWLPQFELKEEEIAQVQEEKTEDGSIITTVLDAASAGEHYTQLYIRWYLDEKGNLTHVERYEQFTTTEDGETFLMGIQMDISLLPTDAEEIKTEIDSALAELPEDDRQEAEPERPAWTMDMSEEEYLAMCRNAVAEIQSREQFHISETLVYYNGETEESRSNVVFWRDGENWLRESYVTRMKENRNLLYYDGILYMQWQQEGEEAEWSQTAATEPESQGYPWLGLVQWDEQTVTFEAADKEGEELCVSVLVDAIPPTIGWDDVQEYNILFFFDKYGNMTQAVMTVYRDNIKVIDDLRIETTLGSDIHNKLENVAAQRPDAPVLNPNLTGDQCMEKCRNALDAYQAQESWVILVENSFSGEGALNETSSQLWYIHGNDWAKQAIVSNTDFLQENWVLYKDDHCYSRDSITVHDPANGEGFCNGWRDYDDISDWPLPWPLEFDWEDKEIHFIESKIVQINGEYNSEITFIVGDVPEFDQSAPMESCFVTFWFSKSGEIWQIDVTNIQIDSNGVKTTVDSTISLYAASAVEAERMIRQCYDEAVAQVGGN